MEEMMAVDGGASKTKAQRQAAQTAAKKNMTKTNVKQIASMTAGYVAVLSGVGALAGGVAGMGAISSSAKVIAGIVSIGEAVK